MGPAVSNARGKTVIVTHAVVQLTACKYRVDQHGACCTDFALSLTDLCNCLQDFEHNTQFPNGIKTATTGKFVPATGA